MLSSFKSRLGARSLPRVVAALMLAAAMLALSGCGDGVAGTYVAEGKATGDSGMKLTLELKSGGVAVLTMGGPDGQSMPPVTGTYTVDGDKVTTVLDNDTDVMTLKDGTLTADFFGEKLVLTKQ